jgi:hypothetical protein
MGFSYKLENSEKRLKHFMFTLQDIRLKGKHNWTVKLALHMQTGNTLNVRQLDSLSGRAAVI